MYIDDDFANIKIRPIFTKFFITGKIGSEVAIKIISTSDEYVVTQSLNETTCICSIYLIHTHLRAHQLRFCMAWSFYLVYVLRNRGFGVDHTSLMYVFHLFLTKQNDA